MSRPEDYQVMSDLEWIFEGRLSHAIHQGITDIWELEDLWEHVDTFDRLVCPDGFSISVQGSNFNYSSPRDNMGPYSEVELGFPRNVTKHDRKYLAPYGEYMDLDDKIEDLVYPYVSADVVRKLIFWHCTGRPSPGKHAVLGVILVLLTLLVYALA